jgi:hypothetical protein
MKFNWGTGLIIAFSLFAAGMIYLVSLCTKQNEDLVSIDYYKQEIQYQSRIDAQKNAAMLSSGEVIKYNDSLQKIDLQLPPEFKTAKVSGTLHFFKPDDASLDFTASISTDNSLQVIPVPKLKKGFWRAKVQWNSRSIDYYHEQNVLIN